MIESSDPVRNWIFTFGYGHKHPITGAPLAGCYVVIRGTHEAARAAMFKAFGANWCFVYESPNDAGVEVYGLIEIPYPEVES